MGKIELMAGPRVGAAALFLGAAAQARRSSWGGFGLAGRHGPCSYCGWGSRLKVLGLRLLGGFEAI